MANCAGLGLAHSVRDGRRGRRGRADAAPHADRNRQHQDPAAKGAGTMAELFKHHKRAFFTVLGYTAGGSLIFYTFTTYMQKYLVNSAGMSIKTASNVMTACLFMYMCMQPLFGALSDRIGRRSNMLLFGALGALMTVPVLTSLQSVTARCGRRADHPGTGHRQLLHLDQRHREGRDVPARSARAGRGAVVRDRQRHLRRHGGIRGAGAEEIGHESYFYWYVTAMMAVAFLVSLHNAAVGWRGGSPLP
jgi:MHS family dicarboxylic acid transporter PcaT-like MFS transporter